MRKVYLGIIVVFVLVQSVSNSVSQTISQETANRLFYTAKVWGFLKYFHPKVNGCNRNMDSVLVALIPRIIEAKSDPEFNDILGDMFTYAGPLPIPKGSQKVLSDREKRNYDLSWFHHSIFTTAITAQLDSIHTNFRNDSNCYYRRPEFNYGRIYNIDEKEYLGAQALEPEYRLLLLFRYWNIVNYFFPYKYAMDIPWDSTLADFIPQTTSITDSTSFHLFFQRLQTRLNDSHGFTGSALSYNYFGTQYFPFSVAYVDGKTVISKVLEVNPDITVGDVILSIDGIDIQHFRDSIRKYVGGSNLAAIERDINRYIPRGVGLHGQLVLENELGIRTIELDRIMNQAQYEDYISYDMNTSPVWSIMPGNVGYVNIGLLFSSLVDSMYEELKYTNAIVFDMRNGTHGTLYNICNRILEKKNEFVRFTYPNASHPGSLVYDVLGYFCGPATQNPDWYKGAVLILMNEYTQSSSEFHVMGFETHPNAIKVGSNTAGADGNIMHVIITPDLYLYYSSIGVYYPDWTETQRIGLKPDIEVKPTVEGIRDGRDEVLEAALRQLNRISDQDESNKPLQVYPNPFEDKLVINLPVMANKEISLRMYDGLGRALVSKQMDVASSGELNLVLDQYLPTGVYVVEIVGLNFHASRHVVKY